jgi:hypothetical protein
MEVKAPRIQSSKVSDQYCEQAAQMKHEGGLSQLLGPLGS